jgi:hypothetical protein
VKATAVRLPLNGQVARVAEGNQVTDVVRFEVPRHAKRLEWRQMVDVKGSSEFFGRDFTPSTDLIPLSDRSHCRPPRRPIVRFIPTCPSGIVLAAPRYRERGALTQLRAVHPFPGVRRLDSECRRAYWAGLRHRRWEMLRSSEAPPSVRVRGASIGCRQPCSEARLRTETAGLTRHGRERRAALLASRCVSRAGRPADVRDVGPAATGVRAVLPGPTHPVLKYLSASRTGCLGVLRWIAAAAFRHGKSDRNPLRVYPARKG